jgi:hypothetical protein
MRARLLKFSYPPIPPRRPATRRPIRPCLPAVLVVVFSLETSLISPPYWVVLVCVGVGLVEEQTILTHSLTLPFSVEKNKQLQETKHKVTACQLFSPVLELSS